MNRLAHAAEGGDRSDRKERGDNHEYRKRQLFKRPGRLGVAATFAAVADSLNLGGRRRIAVLTQILGWRK